MGDPREVTGCWRLILAGAQAVPATERVKQQMKDVSLIPIISLCLSNEMQKQNRNVSLQCRLSLRKSRVSTKIYCLKLFPFPSFLWLDFFKKSLQGNLIKLFVTVKVTFDLIDQNQFIF